MNSPAPIEPNHRVLIIDDNEAIHDDLRKILAPDRQSIAELQDDEALLFGAEPLELVRFDIDSAYQGEEGLEMVRRAGAEGRPYAVAFVDIRMPPGWDGVETIARLRQINPDLQAVICTAYSDYSWNDIHRRLGHSDSLLILKKPFDNIEVIQLAHALSRKWLVTRQAEARMADLDNMVAKRTADLEEAHGRIRVELEERTAAQEAFKTIFHAGPIGIALIDSTGHLVDANLAFDEQLKMEKGEFVGNNRRQLAGINQHALDQFRDELLRTGRLDAREVEISRDQDGTRTALIWIRVVEIQQERHYLAFVLDITERRRMEEDLREARIAAEAAAKVKSEFLANVSHEIRTPMNGIIGFTQLSLRTELSAEQRDYLEIVDTSAQSLLGIINDILDFSKIEAGKLELENIAFSLRDCVEQTIRMVQAEAQRKQLSLSTDIGDETPDLLTGDPGRLRQVLLNLLSNAVKFTERGSVKMEVSGKGGGDGCVTLKVAVRDTGIGVPLDSQSCLFEPFRQVDGSVTRKYGGTGLGLSISAQLVHLMGGRIWLESQPRKGSTFWFTANFSPAQAAKLPPPELACAHVSNHAYLSILVAEDNPTNRMLASTLLKRSGHSVTTASNGVEAVNLVDQNRFDLVLMDLQMPEMDGFQALAEIRRREHGRGRRLPIVAVTAHAMEGERDRCLEAGMDGYLSKPYGPKDLFAVVSRFGGEEWSRVPGSG